MPTDLTGFDATAETLSCSLTIQIRKDGGAPLASATYTLEAAGAV